jgi:Fe-S-cluster containining protein
MATFGELVERGLGDEVVGHTQAIIARAVGDADAMGKAHLRVVSCHTCTAPKGCCSLITTAFLHEAAGIAARLRRDGRDTPELRAQLRRSAEAMENSSPRMPYQSPCVFLDGDERCTVYDVRPMECGVRLVYSPARACSTPGAEVELFDARTSGASALRVAETFRARLGLPALTGGRLYAGAMPRMVLVCLQTWDRADFVKVLGKRDWPAGPRSG